MRGNASMLWRAPSWGSSGIGKQKKRLLALGLGFGLKNAVPAARGANIERWEDLRTLPKIQGCHRQVTDLWFAVKATWTLSMGQIENPRWFYHQTSTKNAWAGSLTFFFSVSNLLSRSWFGNNSWASEGDWGLLEYIPWVHCCFTDYPRKDGSGPTADNGTPWSLWIQK